MAWFSKILAPVEFSPQCLSSALYAEALARHFRCDLTLLHVVTPPFACWAGPDVAAFASVADLDSGLVDQAQAQLRSFPVAAPEGGHVSRVVLEGDPASAIAEYAQKGHFDLIVMPTHCYRALHRLVQGSVTERVLGDAQCPVWTGAQMKPAHDGKAEEFHTILCALDMETGSEAVLQWAATLAREYGAQLHVVHVVHGSSVSVGGFYFDPDWHDMLVGQARDRILGMLRVLQTNAPIWIETGEAPEQIGARAERIGADLIVIGRGRHNGLLGRLHAHAYAIVRESPCPAAAV